VIDAAALEAAAAGVGIDDATTWER